MKRTRISFFISLVLIFLLAPLQAQVVVTIVDTVTTPTNCEGDSTGTVTVYISTTDTTGGVNYIYSLNELAVPKMSSGPVDTLVYTFNNVWAYDFFLVTVEVEGQGGLGSVLVFPVSVEEPDPIEIDEPATITPITCYNENDGIIKVLASGEGDNLLYTLTGPVSDTSSNGEFYDLPEGLNNYRVRITDKDGCPSADSTELLTIYNPDSITVSEDAIIDVKCYGEKTGEIYITPSGGTPSGSGTGYTYLWSDPSIPDPDPEDVTGLESGFYSVTVFDANMCQGNGGPYPVGQTADIEVTRIDSSMVTCADSSNGSFEITVIGGVGGYSYSWVGDVHGLVSTDEDPTNLPADTYDLTIVDDSSCLKTFTDFTTITKPDPITIPDFSFTPALCYDSASGTATISPLGGTPVYTFAWLGTNTGHTSAAQNPTDLPADVYSVTIDDSLGCSQAFPDLLTIGQPDSIWVTVTDSTDVSCFGEDDGSASIDRTGGTSPFDFTWTGDTTSHTSDLENPDNLVADMYDLEVKDGNGCIRVFNDLVSISQPGALSILDVDIIDIDCNGDSTGAIDITPGGGEPDYTYQWSGPGFSATSQDISNLKAGSYSVIITDLNECDEEFLDVATVDENTLISATFVRTPVSCNGDSTGAIDATVIDGTPDYIYSWTGPSFIDSTEDISGLRTGSYRLTVTDVLGCTEVMPDQEVTQPAPIDASVSVINNSCFGDSTGSVNLTPSGGIGPYTFVWTGPPGFNETTEDITGLKAGSYSVTVTDTNKCAVPFADIATVTEPFELQVSSVKSDISCGGYSDGSIDITVTGGTAPYGFRWTGPGGFDETTRNIAGLDSGIYNLTVTYGTGCSVDFPALDTITEPESIIATHISQVDVLCFGEATGSIVIDTSGGTAPLSIIWTNSSGATVSTNKDPSGLPADTYSLDITDAGSCSVSYPDFVTISESPAIDVSLAKTDILCKGDKKGTITVTASGGTGPLRYSYIANLPIFYQDSNVFYNVGANDPHTVWTRDSVGCVVTDTITVHEPVDAVSIIGEEKSGQILCYGDSSAQISIYDVRGGVEPYEYSISGPGGPFFSTSLFPNLSAGNYQTAVRDANGCTEPGSLINISQPDSLWIDTYTQEDITSCSYDIKGRIIIIGDGGSGGGTISYTLNDTLTKTIGDFQNLPGGAHTITMEDKNGCTSDTTVVILAPPQIDVDNVIIIPVTGCFGDSTGEISVTGSGGSGTITYSRNGEDFQPGGTFSNLPAGIYTITLMDSLDCTLDTVVTITEPGPITITSELVTPIGCFREGDGIIEIQVSGGTGPFSYILNPGDISDPAGVFPGLDTGTYVVTVDDSIGCGPVDSSPLILADPPEFFFDSIKVDNISCNGAGNGSMGIYVSGGVAPYQYSIDNQVTWVPDSIHPGLSPDTFNVFVMDANLCIISGDSIVLTEPPPLLLSVFPTDITGCSGDSTGMIEASGGGGTGFLEYSLNGIDYQDTGTFVNLFAGPYTVYLKDSTSCILTEPVTINEPAPVKATIETTDATSGNLGSITISSATGGTSPYEYTIDGPGEDFSADTFYSDLEAATYHVIVRDLNNCTFDSMVVILDVVPLDMDVTVIPVTCFGAGDGSIEMVPLNAEGTVDYSIDSGMTVLQDGLFENLPGDSTYYLLAIDEAGKVFTDSVTINQPPEVIVSWVATPAECNAFSETGAIDITAIGEVGGFTYLWSDGNTEEDRTGIVAGNYILETTDANNCTRADTILVSSMVIVVAYAGEDTTICQGDSIQLQGQGGHIPSWSPATFLSDPDTANPLAIRITETTTYVLTITEDNSAFECFNTDSVTISIYPTTGLEVTEDTVISEGESVQLETFGGPFSTFDWEPITGLDNSTISNPVATPEVSTRYMLVATNEFGCEETDSLFIEVTEEVMEDIMAYNVFSPNGDGINDYFDIENAERFPEMIVEVYSRWGDLFFSTVGYDDSSRWDGTTRGGKEAPFGTYYYVIIPYSGALPITGNVTIIR